MLHCKRIKRLGRKRFDDYTLDFPLILISCVIQRDVAQKGKLVWLKALQEEMITEASGMLPYYIFLCLETLMEMECRSFKPNPG